jgi:hypothetical protein
MAILNVDREAVLRAVAEYNRLGRDEFLKQYKFGPAKRYFLVLDGTYYDSKAIVGAAQTLNGGPRLTAEDFSGGEATVVKLLTGLGFTVEQIDGHQSSRAVTEQNLGAWVIKCDPEAWDLELFIEDGNRVIEDWRVVRNYRSRMMRSGHKVLLWQTDSDPEWRGFRGAGWIIGGVEDFPTASVLADDSYWIDREILSRSELRAPMNLEVWDYPISEAEMLEKQPELAAIEVVKMRQCSNPSWLSREQLAMLQDLLKINRDVLNPGITITAQGAGYGSPQSRWVVEAAAIDAVTHSLNSRGYSVTSVESEKVGWDLTCESTAGSVIHVEVKGVSGTVPSVLLTRNEVAVAGDDPAWVLAVVTSALSAPRVQFFERERVIAAADPMVFRAEMSEFGWEPFDDSFIVYSSEIE